MKMKDYTLLVMVLMSLTYGCTSTPSPNKASGETKALAADVDTSNGISSSMDDYIIYHDRIGNITYSIASYEPMETWFTSQAKGKSDEEILTLYDQLPLIKDTDSYDHDSPEKNKRIMAITEAILENENYAFTKQLILDSTAPALEKSSQFFSHLYPEQEMNIILVLNPFFVNGGMGIMKTLPDGRKQGRLEVGTAVMSDAFNDELDAVTFLAHELTHIVHQYFGGASEEIVDFTSPDITMDLSLFMEGAASYYSGLIAETDDYGHIFLQKEYDEPGPIYDEGFVKTVAAKYYEEMAGQPYSEVHRLWYSGFTAPEERPFAQYPAIAYFLGYHAVKNLIETEAFTLKSLLERPAMELQEPIRRAVRNLMEG